MHNDDDDDDDGAQHGGHNRNKAKFIFVSFLWLGPIDSGVDEISDWISELIWLKAGRDTADKMTAAKPLAKIILKSQLKLDI